VRVLGIDFGERRIGLAISDTEGRWALPLTILKRTTDRRAAYEIATIVRREGVERLVMGEPRGPEGERGPAAERMHRFGVRVARATRLEISYHDETLTTVAARERLDDDGLARRPRLDAHAAQIILQEALDTGLGADQETGDPT
jgi:putative Holliday junction resolvase